MSEPPRRCSDALSPVGSGYTSADMVSSLRPAPMMPGIRTRGAHTRLGRVSNALPVVLVALGSLVVMLGTMIAADLYVHTRHSVNLRGYRGPILGAKAAGETRIAVVGESTAFGYGVDYEQAIPTYLQSMLRTRLDAPLSVANLAYNNETAACYASTLQQYAYLQPDVVVIYSGYNDIGATYRAPSTCFRNASTIFRLTGYMPLLPIALRQQYYVLRYGSVESGYADNLMEQSVAAYLAANEGVASSGQAGANAHYAGLIAQLVDDQLRLGRKVMFVTQPYGGEAHRQQQAVLRATLSRFEGVIAFRYLDLGETIDLRDSSLSYDGMHLTAEGNRRIAQALVAPLAQLVANHG